MRVSDWEMRCIYNHSDLEDRLKCQQLKERIPPGNPTTRKYKQKPGTITEAVFYDDAQTGEEIAEFSQFKQPDGELGASGLRDPKHIKINGVWYRRLKGDDVTKDITKLFPGVFPVYYLAFAYSKIRKRICRELGIVADAEFGKRYDGKIRRLFFFFEPSRTAEICASPLRNAYSRVRGRIKKCLYLWRTKAK